MKRIGCKGFCWLLTLLSLACLFGCAGEGSPTPEATQAAVTWDTLEFDRSMELLYADQFSVDYDQGGYAKLTIGDADTYLVVPEGAAVPSGLPEGVTVLEQPLDSVYLVATSAMDLFRELDAMDAIRLVRYGCLRLVHPGGKAGYGGGAHDLCGQIQCPGL